MLTVLSYTIIPVILMLVGSIIAFFKKPGKKFSSAVQHFAGGIVFAAVAVELIPIIHKYEIKWITAIGFSLGVILMLTTEWFAHKLSEREIEANKLPIAMITAIGIDMFIDGILVGVSFLADEHSGIVIALALSLETLFLGISTTIKLTESKTRKFFGLSIVAGLALLVLVGALIGYGVLSILSIDVQLTVISLGIAALLYLVTEELLIEAHKIPETRIATVSFFLGFLIVLLFS